MIRAWCSPQVRRAAKKSKHAVGEECETVLRVLALHRGYGDSVPGHPSLRKMRVALPGAGIGKSGGYRLVYREADVDQARHVLLLRLYFKGDQEDLGAGEYRAAREESQDVLADVLAHEFRDVDPPMI